MRTFRTDLTVRSITAAVALTFALLVGACGSSSTSTSTSSPSTNGSTAGSATDSTASPASIPPAPSTIPSTLKAPCSALASALAMSELHPRNAGNWPAERQRIITDAATNVELFAVAINGVPPEIAKALETLRNYSSWLGETVANATSFDQAVTAVNTSPDLVDASLATSVVDTWKSKNC